MPCLSNPRHERFSQFVARGFTQTQAYAKAGFNASESNRDCSASKLADREDVQQRIEELIAKNGELQELSRKEILDFLAEVITTPIGSVTPNSRLAQSVLSTDGKHKTYRVSIPCKMKALEIYNKMVGNNEPERLEIHGEGRIEAIVDASLLQELTKGYHELRTSKESK